VTSVIGLALPSFPVTQFSRWLFSNCSHCSLLKAARPERFPDKMPAGPVLLLTSSFPRAVLLTSLLSFRRGPTLHDAQSLTFRNLMKSRLLASRPPTGEFVRGPHVMSSRFPDVAAVSCFVLWCRCPLSWRVPYDYVRCVVQERHSGSTVLRWRPTSAGTHHRPGSLSSAVRGALQPNAGPHIGPPVQRVYMTQCNG
jgi:hypothetical protein